MIEHSRPRVPHDEPRPAPSDRAQPFLILGAGIGLSLIVLALTFSDLSWVRGWPSSPPEAPGAVAEPAVAMGAIEEPPPAAAAALGASADPQADQPSAPGDPPSAGLAPRAAGVEAPRPEPSTPERAPAAEPPAEAQGEIARAMPIPQPRPAELPAEAAVDEALRRAAAAANPALGAPAPAIVQAAFEEQPASAAPASAAAGIRVFIHYPANRVRNAVVAERLAGFLVSRGFEVADIRPVEARVDSAGVRYFFASDQADSERLLEEIDRFFDGSPYGVADQASDLTHYVPKPRVGNVEVWLPTS